MSIFFDLGCLFFYQLFFRAASTLIGRYKIEIILENFRGMFKSFILHYSLPIISFIKSEGLGPDVCSMFGPK